VSSATVNAHAIRVGAAWPNCHDLHRSGIFLVLELLNTIMITFKSPNLELCPSPSV
jgi:hypothetical protein